MHEHPSGFTWGNTAASLVVELHDDPQRPIALWWCPVTPCTGVYLPFFVDSPQLPDGAQLPMSGANPWDPRRSSPATFDSASSWWQWQQLLDAAKDPAKRDFAGRAQVIRAAFDPLESRWLGAIFALSNDPVALEAFTSDCLGTATATVADLLRGFGADLGLPIDPRWTPPTSP
jgi:secernin